MESHQEDKKTIKYFIIKYIFRLIHIISFSFIFGNVAYDLFISRRLALDSAAPTDKELKKMNDIYFGLTCTCYILIIVSGLINMILLVDEKKYIKDNNHSLWKYLLIAKTFTTILLSPILDFFIGLSTKNENYSFQIALITRFICLLLLTLLSPFLRFFREYYMMPAVAKGKKI